MTDSRNETTKGNAALRVLGLKKSVPPPVAELITNESEQYKAAIKYAIGVDEQLRASLSEWRQKAEETATEYAAFKADVVEDIRVEKHEHDSKVVMLKAKIDALDAQLKDTVSMYEGQLKDTRRELNHYSDLSRELSTKCEDLEKMYLHQLRAIRDAAHHMAVGIVKNMNDTTNTINTSMNNATDAAQHCVNGLVNQVESSAKDMAVFIDDIKKRRNVGEYEPRANPLAEKLQPLAPDAEEALARLVQTYKARAYETSNNNKDPDADDNEKEPI